MLCCAAQNGDEATVATFKYQNEYHGYHLRCPKSGWYFTEFTSELRKPANDKERWWSSSGDQSQGWPHVTERRFLQFVAGEAHLLRVASPSSVHMHVGDSQKLQFTIEDAGGNQIMMDRGFLNQLEIEAMVKLSSDCCLKTKLPGGDDEVFTLEKSGRSCRCVLASFTGSERRGMRGVSHRSLMQRQALLRRSGRQGCHQALRARGAQAEG